MKTIDPVTLATPFFILTIILEIVFARLGKARANYEAKDTAVSLGMGLGSTIAGVLIGANGWLGLATLGVWLGVAFTLRYSSLAALCAALAAPAVAFVLGLDAYWVLACSVMSALLIWRHKDNIKRLIAGQESRIGSKKKSPGA